MKPATIVSGGLSIDLANDGSITLARTDIPGSIHLSRSEWEYILQVSVLFWRPHAPPAQAETVLEGLT